MFYFLSLIWVISISGFFVLVFKKRFGYVLTPSFVISVFILYIFSYLNQLSLGFYVTWLLVIAFWSIIVYLVITKKKEQLQEFKSNYFTIALPVFLFLLVYLFLLFRYRGYVCCDDFAHWGRMVIASIKVNGLYTQPQDILFFHQDYPPFFTLFECLWCGFGGFKFHEWYTFIALDSFMLSCFMPLFEKININSKKDYIKIIIGVVCIILVGTTISATPTRSDNAYFYNSIYVDWALSLFAAYSFFMVVIDHEWNWFSYFVLSLNLSAILMIKQMGICYYLIILFFAFTKIAFVDKKLNLKELALGVGCFVGIPLCFYLSWKAMIAFYDLTGQFVVSNMKFKDVLDIMRWDYSEQWRSVAYSNFRYEISNRPLLLHPFEMTYPIASLILGLLLIVSTRIKKSSLFAFVSYMIGAVGYAIVIMLLYMLAFDSSEAPALASFDRYMISYLFFGIVLVFMCAFYHYSMKESFIQQAIVLVLLCLFIESETLYTIVPIFNVDSTNDINVLVVRQGGKREYHREDLNGTRMSFDVFNFTKNKITNLGDSSNYTNNEWIELLKKYKFVFIEKTDDVFYEHYWFSLKQDDFVECYNDQLYSTQINGDTVVFTQHFNDFMAAVLRFYLLDY